MLARKALAGTAGAAKEYVEDVFSTYLYTGNGSTQTITNNIDLSGKGGMVWVKARNIANAHQLMDTERGTTKVLSTSSASGSGAESTDSTSLTAFNNNGFSIGASNGLNENTYLFTSWTFRQAEKFFDVVTYSGNSVDDRAISHNLGSTPGCVIVRRRSGDDWFVYHRSLSANNGLRLNKTDAASSNTATVKSVSSTTFTVGTDGMVNVSGSDYVAYLFAHDAGGFGDAGSDSIIKCDTFTTDGSGNSPTVNLGWEPQWLLVKQSGASGSWYIIDTMRGWNNAPSGSTSALTLYPNLSNAEAGAAYWNPTSTGFYLGSVGSANTAFIYIAIRRGPMKTPTSGTDVFAPIYANQSAGTKNTTNFPVDAMIIRSPSGGENNHLVSRLTGVSTDSTDSGNYMYTQSTAAEASGGLTRGWDNTGFQATSGYAGYNVIYLPFRRAPGFFDVVCWTGTGSNRTVSHNLGVAPELMLVKRRNTSGTNWIVYANNDPTDFLLLNLNNATFDSDSVWNDTSPTSTNFTLGTAAGVNASGDTYVAYLFASVSGVSKVGTYTGNGSSVTVTTNFQPRFIMVKRTDSTGDWIVGNSARGLVAGDDPYIELNTTDAEVTNDDWVDITSTSFTINQTATSNANVNTGTYIYLAIA